MMISRSLLDSMSSVIYLEKRLISMLERFSSMTPSPLSLSSWMAALILYSADMGGFAICLILQCWYINIMDILATKMDLNQNLFQIHKPIVFITILFNYQFSIIHHFMISALNVRSMNQLINVNQIFTLKAIG